MCDCIELRTKDIKEHLLKNPAVKRVAYVLIPQTMTKNPRVGIPATVMTYRVLKNGKEKGMEGTTTILAAFCPFCGEKYEDA